LAKIVVKFLGDAKGLTRTLGVIKGKMAAFGGMMKSGALIAGTALLGVGAVSLKAFADFDQAMTQSTAIMGDLSDTQLSNLESAARDMAKTTTFSAKEAADSIFFLASAGLDAEQTIGALPAVAKFAQAGMFDMATATDLLTDAQSALGLTVDDAADNQKNMIALGDVLVGANTLANASVEQFSAALTNKAGPSMRAYGLSVEEGVAVLAALADQGIKGEVAGTQFSAALRNLTTQAVKNSDVFDELGVAVFDSEGNMNNMADVVGDLEGLLGGMSTEQQKATLLQLGFADKAQATLLALLGQSDAIRTYQNDLEEMGGITEEVADKQLESFSSQMNLIKSRVMDVAITIGSHLAPIVLASFDLISKKWAEWGPTIKQSVAVVITVIASIIDKVREFVDKFRGDSDEAGTQANKLREMFDKIWAKVQEVLPKIMALWTQIIDTLTTAWAKWGDDILAFLDEAITAIMRIIDGFIEFVQGFVNLVQGIIDGDWAQIWEGVKQMFSGLFDAIMGLWDLFFARLRLTGTIIWDILKGLFTEPFNWVKDEAGVMVDAIVNFIKDLPRRFVELHAQIAQAGIDMAAKLLGGIIEGMKGAPGFVSDFASGIGRAMIGWINSNVIDWINNKIPDKIAIPYAPDINLPNNPLPHIPSFAQGAFVTEPTLALVGDAGVNNGEIITPEAKMRQVIREEAPKGLGGGITIDTINMNTDASVEDLSRELAWIMMTNGVAA